MSQRSSLTQLPEKILAQVNFMLTDGGWTIADVVEYLSEAGHPKSKSAVGRYKLKLDRVAVRLRESREITDALVRDLGEASAQGKQGRLLVEMARSLVFDLLMKLQDEEAELDTKDVAFLGKGLAELGKALRLDQDFEDRIVERAAKEAREAAAAAVQETVGEMGFDEEQAAFIRAKILGVEVEVDG